jgi:PAS domain S-box-containing protein
VVVEKHGGELTFETTSGKGTTFFMRLPLDSGRKTVPCACCASSQIPGAPPTRPVRRWLPVAIEETAELVDGHHVYLNSKFPLVDSAGRVYGVGGISHDITDRKRAEEALRESERRYATMFHRSPLAKAWSQLPEGTLAEVNDAWVTLTGIPREEAIGKTGAEIGLVEPDTRSRFHEEVFAQGSAQAEMTISTRTNGHRLVFTRVEHPRERAVQGRLSVRHRERDGRADHRLSLRRLRC